MAKKTPNSVDVYVGARIRMRRLQLGYAQEKLGDAIGISFQQIQKYEKGTNRVGSSRLDQIAKILKVSVAFFFEGKSDSDDMKTTPAEDFLDLLQSKRVIALLKAIRGIDDESLEALTTLAKKQSRRASADVVQLDQRRRSTKGASGRRKVA
jgi:transcriptional regulator with XRE-family HTH domain